VVTAVKTSKKGGTVVIVGIHPQPITIDFGRMVAHEKTFIGSSAYTGEYPMALSLLADRRVVIEPLITGRIGLVDLVRKGFDVLVEQPGEHVKIIVRP
jgi:(R,R)-butanediol dehydrogenase/meso-butanediol dehydrogenase/diacetyl reductase